MNESVGLFSRVLVGVDGRSGGRDAIALARQLADPDARLVLATVCPEREHVPGRANEVLATIGGPSVGSGLHLLAQARAADLLVVGSTSQSAVGPFLLIDHTRGAINGAPFAVAIAPRGYAADPRRMTTVGVACDGTPESQAALAAARGLAARDHLRISALSVIELPELEPTPVGSAAALRRRIEAEQQRLVALEGVRGEAVYGIVGEALAQFSEQVELLVVGSRGYGPLGRLLNGSTSNFLARHSRCPLLVLPRGWTPDRAGRTENSGDVEALA